MGGLHVEGSVELSSTLIYAPPQTPKGVTLPLMLLSSFDTSVPAQDAVERFCINCLLTGIKPDPKSP